MKQKVTVNNTPKTKQPKYPYIGIFKSGPELVVFFTRKNEGVCISTGDSNNTVGQYSSDWNEERFDPLDGFITWEQEA